MRDDAQIAEVRDKLTAQIRFQTHRGVCCDFRDPWGNRIHVVDLHDESLICLLSYREVQKVGVRFAVYSPGAASTSSARDSSDTMPASHANPHERQPGRGRSWRDYVPLFVIVVCTMLAASAKQFAASSDWQWIAWMHDFMGFFLVVFAMFKFFDLEGFADGFHMYDLLAKVFRPYGYVYPFLELALGLGYLAHWWPALVYGATLALLGFGALGVLWALWRKLDVECACLGTLLKVPLSTVAVLEDLGMAAMAAAMLAGASAN